MKTWTKPVVNELNINETEYNLLGWYSDGGYTGDGILSGHSTFDKPEKPTQPTNPTNPTNPIDPDIPITEMCS